MSIETARRDGTAAAQTSPKYRSVAAELVARIRTGLYPPGALLPSEPGLTREFGVSRHTVRAALRALYEEGLVISQRGRGTVVQSVPVAPRYRQVCDSVEDVLQYAAAAPRRVELRRRLIADEQLATMLGCAAGYPWWEIRTTRQLERSGPIVASSLIWVPDQFAEAVAALDATDEPLFVLLERRYGCRFAQIRQTVSVAWASPEEAAELGLEPGAAVMCVERRFVDERGGLLEMSRTVHPPESFRYETTLRRVVGDSADP